MIVIGIIIYAVITGYIWLSSMGDHPYYGEGSRRDYIFEGIWSCFWPLLMIIAGIVKLYQKLVLR